jgi:hypothetical protein
MSDTSAEFWIYEDVPTHVARLHHRSCGHCKDGQGHNGTRDEAQNWWRPFASLEEARSAPLEASSLLSECRCVARSGV